MGRSLGSSGEGSWIGDPVVGFMRPAQWGGGDRRSMRPPKREEGPVAHLRAGGCPTIGRTVGAVTAIG